MSRTIKAFDQPVTEELIQGMIGRLVHAPTNKHVINNPMENNQEEEVNAWFAGQVAGYEKAYIQFDYEKNEMLEEPQLHYNLLLTDGMGYLISQKEAEIFEITDTEWESLLAEYHATEMVKEEAQKLILPDEDNIIQMDKKIILPGDEK